MELADFVAKFEGFSGVAYKCPAGVWTLGFGSTYNPFTKAKIKEGDKITRTEALTWLNKELSDTTGAVQKTLKVSVNSNQLNALTSFAFNVGIGNLQKSTLLKLLNAGSPKEQVAAEFIKWNKAGGKVLKGLTIRRQAERDLFLS